MRKETQDYLDALDMLELAPFGKKASAALGLKMRQLARLAAGDTLPSPTLERLLSALMELKKKRR